MTEINRNGSSEEDAKEDKGKGLRRLWGVIDDDDRLIVLAAGLLILLFLGAALFIL